MPDAHARSFPDGFIWGVATSAHQIEGAVDEGGRGESIWDRFAATPGKIADGSDAARRLRPLPPLARRRATCMRVAGARRLPLLHRLAAHPADRARRGQRGRASTSTTPGRRAARAPASRPFVTLYHWDLPQALQDRGRLGDRARTVDAFVEYADVVTRRLGDRVRHWVTHNEPWCIATLGHERGAARPGPPGSGGGAAAPRTTCCSRTAGPCRSSARTRPGPQVGIVLNLTPAHAGHAVARPTATRRAASTGCSTAGSSTRCFAAATRPTSSPIASAAATCPAPGCPSCSRATWRPSPRRSTSSASTTTAARSLAGRPRRRAGPQVARPAGAN